LLSRTREDDADTHLSLEVMAREIVIAVTSSRPDYGTWEHIL
jgi:thiamine phosphate synthase YjbQ (UPF0047 family)